MADFLSPFKMQKRDLWNLEHSESRTGKTNIETDSKIFFLGLPCLANIIFLDNVIAKLLQLDTVALSFTKIVWYLLFTIYYLLFTIYYLLFTIYYLLFTIYYLLFTNYYLLFTKISKTSFTTCTCTAPVPVSKIRNFEHRLCPCL